MFSENSMSFNTGVAIVSIDHTFSWVNETFGEIIGYTPQDLAGSTFESITHPDDLSLDSHLTNRLFRGEIDTYEMEKRYLHRDGGIVPIHLTVRLIRSRDGKILYALSTVEKISERAVYHVQASKPLTPVEIELDRIRRAVIGG
jgi:PAS domain S-box-containing protein